MLTAYDLQNLHARYNSITPCPVGGCIQRRIHISLYAAVSPVSAIHLTRDKAVRSRCSWSKRILSQQIVGQLLRESTTGVRTQVF